MKFKILKQKFEKKIKKVFKFKNFEKCLTTVPVRIVRPPVFRLLLKLS